VVGVSCTHEFDFVCRCVYGIPASCKVGYLGLGEELYRYLADSSERVFVIKGRRVDRKPAGENVRVVLEAANAETASLWVDLLHRTVDDLNP